jgi:hypothetical protein
VIGQERKAKAPPARAIQSGLVGLRQAITERESRRAALFSEQNKLRQHLYAPVLESIRSDPRSKKASKALAASQKRIGRDIIKLPAIPETAFDIIESSDSSLMVTDPYDPFFAEWHDNAIVARAMPDGYLEGAISPGDGSGWVWAGVGFPLLPARDRVVTITPVMFYRYAFSAFGHFGVSAHCEGALGVHVHRYDGNWQDTGEMENSHTTIWSHTTETGIVRPDPGNTVFEQPSQFFLRGDSNYLIWATLEVSGNCSSGFIFDSSVFADFKARCIYISVDFL